MVIDKDMYGSGPVSSLVYIRRIVDVMIKRTKVMYSIASLFTFANK